VETYAPVPSNESLLACLGVIETDHSEASYVVQIDLHTAFLKSDLIEKICMEPVVIVCAQATCMHVVINWSDYMSYCYKKCDGYRLSWTHVSLLFDLLPVM
jgi:hypothetical protein